MTDGETAPHRVPPAVGARTSRDRLLYQMNTRVHLTDLSRSLGRPATLDDVPDAELDRLAEIGLRLDLAPQRVVHRAGGTADIALKSPMAPRFRANLAGPARRRHRRLGLCDHLLQGCTPPWAARRRWPGCATGCGGAGCGSCSTSSPTTLPWTIAGSRTTPSITSREPSPISPERRKTMPGSGEKGEIDSWPMVGIRTSPVGRTRSS